MIGGTAFAQTTNPAAGEDPAIAGTQTSAPGNTDPERDARGIPGRLRCGRGAGRARTKPTPVAPGAVFTPKPNQQGVFAPRPAAETYPACSRTVTDNCVQTYERGVAAGRADLRLEWRRKDGAAGLRRAAPRRSQSAQRRIEFGAFAEGAFLVRCW